ncbi:MAG: lipid A export permease/ATP-binding protein MsbA [Moraxellaceae bacterium]
MTTPDSSPATTGLQIYGRLLRYTRRFWKAFALGILGFVINAQTEWAGAQLIKYIIDAIQHQDQSAKNWFPVLIVGIFLLRGVGTFMGNYFTSVVARNVVYELRREIFDKLLVLPASYYHMNSPGRIAAKIVYNVEQVTAAATDALKVLVREGLVVVGLLAYLFWSNWKLSMAILLIAPMAAGLVRVASKRFRKLSTRIQTAMGDVNHVANEMITGFQVVKTYGGEAYERDRFDKASRENLRQGLKMVVTSSISTPLVQILMAVAMGVVIWVALQPGLLGDFTAGQFVAYITAAGLLSKPVRALTEVNEKIQRGIAASASVFELLDLVAESDEGQVDVARLMGEIEFRQVTFAYDGGENVLKGIDLKVAPGQTVAIVGRSGAGKSTLVNLLPRFHEVTSGELLLDGRPIRDYTLASLRRQIATVSQKVILFDDTIANNIAYGAFRDRLRSEVVAAAKAAHAHEFIEKLPEGYDTRVGQDGVQLSGGQRQRIAIARALLKNAPILILDEATSALDNESEFHIQAALEEVMKGRTTLVIAHRLSTIENADWIVVMEQGRIVESGRHADLLAQDGLYAQMHRRAFAEDEPAAPGAV